MKNQYLALLIRLPKSPSASSAVKKVWLWLAVAVVLTGCAVGPNYHRPPVTPPAAFRGEVAPSNAASLADAKWFEVFKDAQLQSLIRTALDHNYDVLEAAARIEA